MSTKKLYILIFDYNSLQKTIQHDLPKVLSEVINFAFKSKVRKKLNLFRLLALAC